MHGENNHNYASAAGNIQNSLTWRGRIIISDCQRQSSINAKVITDQNTNNNKKIKKPLIQ